MKLLTVLVGAQAVVAELRTPYLRLYLSLSGCARSIHTTFYLVNF
ncbi:hypothetical protein [Chamaesiphon sp. VAR_69_metabat_338]|nr:hypothetical protein [Chamaesiphon sp. VAR_69_metabat_338]